ncbi:formate dehydrogenase accessory sulfurtransferase FdhD [Gulosibacter sp. GYB002]|uniref:formate dehydrogenase accessory sulfurtransferase FdhD n=1 Tax=Gulosibacter sp. GYB002 TaxID=2994391 RepID=UPI002F96CF9E
MSHSPASRRVTKRRRTLVIYGDGDHKLRRDTLAGEEPLEIRVNDRQLAVTMRTPGDDFDLVAGNLVSEGLISHREQLHSMRYCGENVDEHGDRSWNVIDAALPQLAADAITSRRVITTSACGVCGATSIDAVRRSSVFGCDTGSATVARETLLELPELLRAEQRLFDSTGGLHAAGLFRFDGTALYVREDVGRHNAVDKVIGAALRDDRLPATETVMQVSGRASFELVQKCHLAGVPVMAAVSAPSSLAAELADEVGITLVGFSRGERATIYTHPQRVAGCGQRL